MKKSKSKEIYEEHKRQYLDRVFWPALNELEKFLDFRSLTDEEREASREDAEKYFSEHGELIEIEEKDINDIEL